MNGKTMCRTEIAYGQRPGGMRDVYLVYPVSIVSERLSIPLEQLSECCIQKEISESHVLEPF